MQYNINVKDFKRIKADNVKGLAAMNYSEEVLKFAKHLVFHYAKYDSNTYILHISDISDFDLHKFAAIIMTSDDAYANEATSYDNPWYEKNMLPALLKYLRNSTDRDKEIEFNKAWREGITKFFEEKMQELIKNACNDRLHTERNDKGIYAHVCRQSGELEWGQYA